MDVKDWIEDDVGNELNFLISSIRAASEHFSSPSGVVNGSTQWTYGIVFLVEEAACRHSQET